MPYVGEFGLEAMGMIRRCGERDFEAIWSIINDGAEAYRGVVPAGPARRSVYGAGDASRGDCRWGCVLGV